MPPAGKPKPKPAKKAPPKKTAPALSAMDAGYEAIKAKLRTKASPFDPWSGRGDKLDSTYFIARPGVNFMRPWLGIRGGMAFQWPLGLEAYTLVIEPTLGIHRYIGDDAVVVDVMHAGEERFTMSGNFPGDSAPELLQALRAIVYAKSTEEGKILWLPEIVTFAQRVHVARAEFSRTADDRGRDASYSIEFVRIGHTDLALQPDPRPLTPQPHQGRVGAKPRHYVVNSKHRTLRQISLKLYKTANKWRTLYDGNARWFVSNKVPISKAPTYKLPIGMKVLY